MAYYHLYRITSDEDPKLTDAGWDIKKIDELTPKDLETYNIYNGKFIHRYFIPSELANEVLIKRGNNNPSEWKNSSANELEPLSSIKPNVIPDIAPGIFYPEAWEIKFSGSFHPEDYYVKQEYPKYKLGVAKNWDQESELEKPKTLEMGQRLQEILHERDEGRDVSIR